jgi:Pentapeptide repeats (8 copies)
MKTITATELATILDQHKLWLDGKGGSRANLNDADLEGANLRNANLIGADLWGANLWGANLIGANLIGADLTGANLCGADLTGAYLRGASLTGADLTDANLTGADLTGADLTGAYLRGAYLKGTILDKKKEQGTTMILSEEETAAILKMRADKVNKAKIDARDIVIRVIGLVTLELANNRPSNTLLKRTDDCDEDIGSENLETISQILDLMGVKFFALTANRRAITFEYKKLNSL